MKGIVVKRPFPSYAMESYTMYPSVGNALVGKNKERRVLHEGKWYIFKGTKGEEDILEEISSDVLKAERDKVEAEEAEKLRTKGHDCNEFVCHGMYARENGSLKDYYYCGKCNDLLQTG